jgi:hypothetical protein
MADNNAFEKCVKDKTPGTVEERASKKRSRQFRARRFFGHVIDGDESDE